MQAAAKLNVAPMNIMHCVNYTAEEGKTFDIDRVTFSIIERAIHHAEDFCKSRRSLSSWEELAGGQWGEPAQTFADRKCAWDFS